MNNRLKHITKTKNPLVLALFLVVFSGVANAQNIDKMIRKGNKAYAENKFNDAEQIYTKVLEHEPTLEKALFNQGAAFFKQDSLNDALQNFELAAQMFKDPNEKAAAFHNMGNIHFKSQQYEKSIDAYKSALKLNPTDIDTKYNLVLAKKMLEDQQNQNQDSQDQQDKQDENKDEQQDKDKENQDKGDQNKDEQNKDKEGEDEQKNQDQKEGDQDKSDQGDKGNEDKKEGEEQSQQPMPSKLTKEEAQRILEALMDEENKVQEKLIKKKGTTTKGNSDKDW